MSKTAKAILLVVLLVFSFHYAVAEDLTAMTDEELLDLRLKINLELAARYEPPVLQDGMTLAEIFPDKNFAIFIRDKIGAISINDQVTQSDLDRVTDVQLTSDDNTVSSLEGIQYLTNMTLLNVLGQPGALYIPDCFGVFPNLKTIMLRRLDITELPPSIVNCSALKELNLSRTPISKLPDDIGNLSSLKKIDISQTQIESLPASIRLLDLDEFKREGLNLGE